MDKISNILVDDALALEKLFREQGLEVHARAIRIALEEAKTDIIQEQFYGTENIYKGIDSAIQLHRTISAQSLEDISNDDIINILEEHIEDINNLKNIEKAPKFVQANNIPILQTLASLITHIKPQNPANKIDEETAQLVRQLLYFTGGAS